MNDRKQTGRGEPGGGKEGGVIEGVRYERKRKRKKKRERNQMGIREKEKERGLEGYKLLHPQRYKTAKKCHAFYHSKSPEE